jgi:hypothetical protein
MNFKVLCILTSVSIVGGLFIPQNANASFWHKKKKVEVKSESQYKKLSGNDEYKQKGMFNVYQKDGEYYFDIPVNMLGRDMLVLNRLTRVPSELNESGVNRGINYETQMIRFEMDKANKKIYLRQQRPLPQSPASDAITRSIQDNYISPLIASLKIEAFSKDSSSVVVKVTNLYNGKETSINNVFNKINLDTSAKDDLSNIISIKSFSNNVMAKSELTTKVTEGHESVFVTVEVSSSIILLPDVPMTTRYDSPRIGYFTTNSLYFSDSQDKVDTRRYITRWRLIPSDTAAYLRGEEVEPIKPIKFYIDNSVPKKWRKYLIQGITDWNVAFEKIGFKNAIVTDFLPDSVEAKADDINYSTLMYTASTKMNAMGPSTLDPRTGEILEADIMWWHNVVSLLQEWITVQTGAVNKDVRAIQLPDSIMGDAMRFVICHEVGHSLGLRHNMMGSWAYPTDSLRSRAFTDRIHGTSSSIMDYARYNYIAQPGDGVRVLSPHIGAYDMLAIEYGYRWYGTHSTDVEKDQLNGLLDSHRGNLYKYSEAQSARDAVDPRAQSEDLGNDAIRSSYFGIKNLKIVMKNLIKWTSNGKKDQTYEEASRLYLGVVSQWSNYMYHVMANVGGIYIENTTVGDGQKTFTYVSRNKQREAVKFLIDNVFTEPSWLFSTDMSNYMFIQKNTPNGIIEYAPTQVFKNSQAYLFFDLLQNERLMRMLENESVNKNKAYTAVELMNDLHNSIFASTISGRVPNVTTRNTQKLFVDALITAAASNEGLKLNKSFYDGQLLNPDEHLFCNNDIENRYGDKRELNFYGSQITRTSDAISVKRGELLRIRDLLKRNVNITDEAARYHYKDIILRIENALNIK